MKFRLMGITDLSTIDWPGKLAAVIFLQGCNLRCPWCQNVEGVDPEGGEETDLETVANHLAGLKPTVDSIVLTGGEPILQPEACSGLLRVAKEMELSCAVETNATKTEALRSILPYLDLVAIDIKAPLSDPELYARAAGVGKASGLVEEIKKSLELAITAGAQVEVRTTVVPSLNDAEEVIRKLAIDVKDAGRLRLQQFRNLRTLDPKFQRFEQPSRGELVKLARVAKREGLSVAIFTSEGGLEEV